MDHEKKDAKTKQDKHACKKKETPHQIPQSVQFAYNKSSISPTPKKNPPTY
jgi:hypothetical protein